MKRAPAVVLPLAVLTLASCSGVAQPDESASRAAPGTTIHVTLTDRGCTTTSRTAPTGTVTFQITATGSGAVSELELQRGGRIVAERENIAPGLTGAFSADLQPGGYELVCPGGSGQDTTPFSVVAAGPSTPSPTTP